jgi:transcriptional regulator with XRE-family HTH domain
MTAFNVDLDEHLGKALKRMRESRNLTQTELSERYNQAYGHLGKSFSKQSVSEFERGSNEPFRTFLELAHVMGYTPQLQLVRETGKLQA